MQLRSGLLFALLSSLTACDGLASLTTKGPPRAGQPREPGSLPSGEVTIPLTGLRRLSRAEYGQTVKDLLGVAPQVSALPIDGAPFETNDNAEPSLALIEAYEDLAGQVTQTEQLLPKLSTGDRQRMSRHFDEIRDLERRLGDIPLPTAGACQKPGEPPPEKAEVHAYTDEEERARAFFDLIHMAFTCDLYRSGSLMLSMFQAFLSLGRFTGDGSDNIHTLSHTSNATVKLGRVIAWHVRHYAYFLAKCRDTPEGNGRLIDSLAAPFLIEGGHLARGEAHSTEGMAALLGGRAGGLNAGVHVATAGLHPANVLITAMRAVGAAEPRLVEVEGEVPGLRA